MIEIKKNGFYYIDKDDNKKVLIDNLEILAFLREPIAGISKEFLVRDFVSLFKQYESLLLIAPEFTEVFECAEKYSPLTQQDFEFISMSIDSEINALESDPFAKIYLSIQAVYKMSEDFICCFPASQLSFKNIVNSSLKISNKFHLSLELEDNEYRTHLPFNISQFTLFDFISAISSVLISTAFRDSSGIEDEFTLKKNELMSLKETIERELGVSNKKPLNDINIEEETNKVLDDINNLLNNKNKD